MQKTGFYGYCSGKLTKGCELCVLGKKTVLFITGKCQRGCYYCPLPESRKGKDTVFANERELSNVNTINEAIEEAKLCESKGMGITGGDPLLVLDRVEKYVKAFKKKFGKKFHIHIYLPTENVTLNKLERLAAAGIDEVRFHPRFGVNDFDEISKIDLAWSLKKKYGWKVGIEIPAIPKSEQQTINFLSKISNLDFLNLNEFEMSVLNAPSLIKRGMTNKESSVAVKGSEKTALNIIKWCESHKSFPTHYCSAATKNIFQFKNRLKRRGKNVKKEYDFITKLNDIYHGCIYLPETKPMFSYDAKIKQIHKNAKKYKIVIDKLEKIRATLIKEIGIPPKLIEIDKQFLRIITSPVIAKEFNEKIKKYASVALVEEIPTYDRIILGLEWL